MPSDYVTIAQLTNRLQAHVLKTKLESEGIECVLLNEHMDSLYPMSGSALGGVTVQVKKKDQKNAIRILTTVVSNEDHDPAG